MNLEMLAVRASPTGMVVVEVEPVRLEMQTAMVELVSRAPSPAPQNSMQLVEAAEKVTQVQETHLRVDPASAETVVTQPQPPQVVTTEQDPEEEVPAALAASNRVTGVTASSSSVIPSPPRARRQSNHQ